DFLLAATTDAMTGERWRDLLDLDDRWQQFVFEALGRFRLLVEPLTQRDLPPRDQPDRRAPATADAESLERCPPHGVFLHKAPRGPGAPDVSLPWGYRCIVCNYLGIPGSTEEPSGSRGGDPGDQPRISRLQPGEYQPTSTSRGRHGDEKSARTSG